MVLFTNTQYNVKIDNATRSRVIKTKFGLIEGTTKVARNRRYFHAYYGIPYAKAPTGKLRFEVSEQFREFISCFKKKIFSYVRSLLSQRFLGRVFLTLLYNQIRVRNFKQMVHTKAEKIVSI